eukprot:1160075-Pelagomonas_calceolata.AAC.11
MLGAKASRAAENPGFALLPTQVAWTPCSINGRTKKMHNKKAPNDRAGTSCSLCSIHSWTKGRRIRRYPTTKQGPPVLDA